MSRLLSVVTLRDFFRVHISVACLRSRFSKVAPRGLVDSRRWPGLFQRWPRLFGQKTCFYERSPAGCGGFTGIVFGFDLSEYYIK